MGKVSLLVGCLERIITLDAFNTENSNSSFDKLLIFAEIVVVEYVKASQRKKDRQKTDIGLEKSTKTLKITK